MWGKQNIFHGKEMKIFEGKQKNIWSKGKQIFEGK